MYGVNGYAILVEARKHSVVFFNWHHQKEGLLAEPKNAMSRAVD
jgi:hypothetical protein